MPLVYDAIKDRPDSEELRATNGDVTFYRHVLQIARRVLNWRLTVPGAG
jgi:hypothetical protein